MFGVLGESGMEMNGWECVQLKWGWSGIEMNGMGMGGIQVSAVGVDAVGVSEMGWEEM